MIRKCEICGKEFEAKRYNQKFCKDQHYHICVVCGKEFPITPYQISKMTCSKECHDKLCVMNSQASLDPAKYTKVCKLCGKEFTTAYSFQTICNDDHYGVCVVCGSKFKYKGTNYTVQTCSKACKDQLTKDVCIEKYGAIAPMGSAEIQAKSKSTCQQKYGVDNPGQSEELKAVRRATMMSRYGVEYSWQSDEIRAKARKTMEDVHGNCHPNQCPDIVAKIQSNSMKKYGTLWPIQSEEVKAKIAKTNVERYHAENVFQSPEIIDKIKQRNLEIYGHEYAVQNSDIKSKISRSRKLMYADTISDPVKRQNYLEFSEDPITYIQNHFDARPTIHDVSNSIGGMDLSTVYSILGPYEGARLLSRVRSTGEDEIESFILSLDPAIHVLKDCRQVISPKEIDIYLPEYSIGIEFNPTYTHNSSLPSFNSKKCLPWNYHAMKSDMCQSKNVFLFHIFGYEWTLKQDILKSMIRSLLHKSSERYYARNLQVDLINSVESRKFLNLNHRQGYTNSKIQLGLRTSDGDLVSIMTFNRMRSTIGSTKFDTSDTWELSRFCSKLNASVVGGASKLFKYFINHYSYDKIVSFSDRAHTRGNLYSQLGFHKVSTSDPNYVWVHLATDMYYNRVACQKQNLQKLFKDSSLDIENQTEKQIMISHGFVQVFDSGSVRWEYINSNI